MREECGPQWRRCQALHDHKLDFIEEKPWWPLSQGRPLGTGDPKEEGLLPLLEVSAGPCHLAGCRGPAFVLSHVFGKESQGYKADGKLNFHCPTAKLKNERNKVLSCLHIA